MPDLIVQANLFRWQVTYFKMDCVIEICIILNDVFFQTDFALGILFCDFNPKIIAGLESNRTMYKIALTALSVRKSIVTLFIEILLYIQVILPVLEAEIQVILKHWIIKTKPGAKIPGFVILPIQIHFFLIQIEPNVPKKS